MEIKTVGDLIPYRASLKELWAKEEFQPVLTLLNSMMTEAVQEFRTIDLSQSAEDVKTKVAELKVRVNVNAMIHNLPEYIKTAEDTLNQKANKIAQMKASQEGGTI